MPLITIQGTPIQFPDTGNSPVWSDAVIAFAEAVAAALTSTVGTYDLNPQVYSMTSNLNTNVTIPSFQFPVTQVRAAFIRYAVSRVTSTTTEYEAGEIIIDYNPNNPTNHKWEIQREYIGEAHMTFTINDAGQMEFSSASIAGINHVGFINFSAQSLLVS